MLAPPTTSVAVPGPPSGASFDVTSPVLFTSAPSGDPVAVTFTVNEQLAPGASVAPASPMLVLSATAVTVPGGVQVLPVNPLGLATFNPAGRLTVNVSPVR